MLRDFFRIVIIKFNMNYECIKKCNESMPKFFKEAKKTIDWQKEYEKAGDVMSKLGDLAIKLGELHSSREVVNLQPLVQNRGFPMDHFQINDAITSGGANPELHDRYTFPYFSRNT